MDERTTLAGLAAELAAIRTRLDERDRQDAWAEARITEILAKRNAAHQAIREAVARSKADGLWRDPPELRLVRGEAKRRTKRRGKLRSVP